MNEEYAVDIVGERAGNRAMSGNLEADCGAAENHLARPLTEMSAEGTLLRRYVWGNGKLLAQMDEPGPIRVALSDELGNVRGFANANGVLTDQYAYQPYGRLVAHVGQTQSPFAFMGDYGVWNAGNGLYLTRHRAYDANLMRFLQPDPLGLQGGRNFYAYASGNPLFWLDPLGLRDRSADIVALYVNRSDLTVAQKTANIVADIYQEAASSTPEGLLRNRDVINTIQADVGDTFVAGSRFGPANGPTTFGTLSTGNSASGFHPDLVANQEDFGRHLGASFRYGQITAVGYQVVDTLDSYRARLFGSAARASETSAEASMDRTFRRTFHDIGNLTGAGASRGDVYDRVLRGFTNPAK